MKRISVISLFSLMMAVTCQAQNSIELKSPSGVLTLSVGIGQGKPCYRVSKSGHDVISPSVLGVKYGSTEYFEFDDVTNDRVEEINETYTLGHGKRSTYENHCQELTATFTNSQNQRRLTMVFRLYDDCVAFRYTKNDGTGPYTWDQEQTEFNINTFRKCWVQKDYDAGYSAYYDGRSWSQIERSTYEGNQFGYCVPMLVQTNFADSWCLITESAGLSSIAASTLVKGSKTGSVKLEIVKHGKILGPQLTESRFTVPFLSPWRTVIIGSLADIVESTACQNLSPANVIGDDSWVKAGRAAWNWAAEDSSGDLRQPMVRKYIDMAAWFGWEYCLLDDGWSWAQNGLNIQAEASYASQKGVGLLLWFNQNHFQNNSASIYTEMKKYADMGVKGFKIDFFEDDRQEMLSKYEKMLDAAQKLHLVLNFHGCTKPSGLDRTWPNLLTMEANWGNEMYMFWPHMTPSYHVINLALTRNVLGSMDFTPLKWGRSNGSVRSIDNNTWGQELVQCVAFETGLLHPAERPEALQYSVADPLLRRLPVAWDETRCLEAQPDQYVTIARRKGTDWWVATMANDARTATISTDYLEEGKTYRAHIFRDGDYRWEVKNDVRTGITKGQKLTLPVLKYGGAIVVFSTDETFGSAHEQIFEAEHYNQGGTVESDNRLFGGKYVSGLGENKVLVFKDVVAPEAGRYAVTVYFRANSDTKAYVATADGTKSRLTLPQPGVSERDHPGENIGFRTALVTLAKGFNTLTIGNDQGGMAPMVDHITVRPVSFPAAADGELLSADGSSLVNAATASGGTGGVYEVNVDRDGIYNYTIFYKNTLRRASFPIYLKQGANTFTLSSTLSRTNIDKVQVSFVCDAGPRQEEPQAELPTIGSDGYVDWCGFLGLDAATFGQARLIQRNGDVFVVATDADGPLSERRSVAIVNRGRESQHVYVSGRRLGFYGSFINASGTTLWGVSTDVGAGQMVSYTFTGDRLESPRLEAENARINDTDAASLAEDTRGNSSCGYLVDQLGFVPASGEESAKERYIEWDDVVSRTGGQYYLTLNYIGSSRRYAAIYVNGERAQQWTNLNNGATLNALNSQTTQITLQPGVNTIRVTFPGTPSTAAIAVPRIDYVALAPLFGGSGSDSEFYRDGHAIMQKARPLFYNNGTGNDAYQWSNHYQKGSNDRGGVESIWWQGYALATFAEFAKAARGSSDFNGYSQMVTRLANLLPKFTNTIDGRTCWMMRPGYGHRFSDDDAWAGIGLLEAYDVEPRQFYIDQLRLFANWAWQLWDDKGGGGMYWQDAPATENDCLNVKNAANNNPTCIIFTRLYEITGEQVWLDRAVKTYKWVRDVLLDKSDFQVRDNIATKEGNKMNNYKGAYNQGSFINAAVLLYRATGERTYLQDANSCANSLRQRKFQSYNSPVLGKSVMIAKADGDMLGRDLIVIARGFEEMNRVVTTRTNINLIKNTMLNAFGERIDPDCGLMMDGWKGKAAQEFEGKVGYFDGLVQLGFLETFARLAVNDDYEDYATAIARIPQAECSTAADGVVYDLQGRRLNALPEKGVYIVNGQKVIR